MIDINYIRENKEDFINNLKKRGGYDESIVEEILNIDSNRRQIIQLIESLRNAKNEKTRIISAIKDKNVKKYEEIYLDIKHINQKLEELDTTKNNSDELNEILDKIPNTLADDVPVGFDESDNKFIRSYRDKPEDLFFSEESNHYLIGEDLGMMDFEAATKMSGSRFVVLKNDLAKMERALANFMLDIHTEKFGFTEVVPPFIVKEEAMYNAGQLPKFAEDSFLTTDGFRLIPTAEVSLVNLVQDTILYHEELPMRLVAYTPCFRSEAGSAGRDTRGMIRLHQFSKVELVSITAQDQSESEHEYILNASEEILKTLDLPYRVMLLCSGDTSFASRKTYDIEVWLPGQGKYREIASCSNCWDFQARRLKARYKEHNSKQNKFVHTLNGSGLPIGRTIVAILENYRNEDGSVTIPDALVPYMGKKKIEPLK
jgi:seryl-tRNA synthetase